MPIWLGGLTCMLATAPHGEAQEDIITPVKCPTVLPFPSWQIFHLPCYFLTEISQGCMCTSTLCLTSERDANMWQVHAIPLPR